MKKFHFTLLALMACTFTHAATQIQVGDLWFELGKTYATVIADMSGSKTNYATLTEANIPASVTYNNYEYIVTTIGTSAFEASPALQSVTIPSSVTTINTDAFYGCTQLNTLNLPEGLLTIGQRAFYNCNLKDITVPSTVTSVGGAAFKGNPTLSVTWLPVTCTIGTDDSAPFYSTSSTITSFVFGPNVELVPAYICKNMSKLDTVVLPPSVYRLGTNAFQNCTSLKSINLPVTQKTLPQSFLEGCIALETIVLPKTLTTFSTDVFYGCTKLSNVTLHEGIETIGERAFYNCKLTDITIPSTVTSIGNAAFKGNPTTSVTWLPKTCSIGTDESAPFYSTSSTITSFVFGDSVQTVPAYICKHMSQLDTIVLPPSVKSLGRNAFMYCTSLKSINLPKTQKTLPIGIFEGCTSLESIELPKTLTTFSTDVFYGCTKLSNVTLHEGIETIGERAFYNCKLTEITIPSTVTSIGNGAFKGNPTTSVIWLPKTCSIGTDESAPFYSTSSTITSFTFGDSVKTIPAYLCKYMKIDSITIPQTVTSIGQAAFMYCTKLKALEFPKGIKTIAKSVLEGCTGLKKVVIPESATTINQYAFYGCTGLQEIYNYAIKPQTIESATVYNVNKSTCFLYVPIDYIDLYQTANVWKEFLNIIGVATGLHFEEQNVSVSYLKQDSSLYFMEMQTWSVPVAPRIQGFTFLKWEVLPGDLADGIVLQAVYEKDQPTDNEEPTANSQEPKAHKLIRQGKVYILRDDELFTITGTKVK